MLAAFPLRNFHGSLRIQKGIAVIVFGRHAALGDRVDLLGRQISGGETLPCKPLVVLKLLELGRGHQ